MALAGSARSGLGAGARSREPSQLSQTVGGGNADLHLGAAIGVFQADLEIVAQVLAAGRAASAALATEDVSENIAEDVVEDVAHIAEAGAVLAVHAGMTEAVIGGALVGIGKNRIGFVQFLEPTGGFFASTVAIGVMLHGQLTEGWS